MSIIPAAGRTPALLVLAAALAVAIVLVADPAFAQTSGSSGALFTNMTNKACEVFTNARRLFYIGSGIGLVAMAVLAAFGRFQWKWFFSLLGGVVVIAAFTQIMQFLDFGGFASCS